MANLMDLNESLAQEGRLAQNYIKYKKETRDKAGKASFEELADFSKRKMEILLQLIKKGNWNVN